MPAIIQPYQTLFYNPRNRTIGGNGYPILGRTIRPHLNNDFIHLNGTGTAEEDNDTDSEPVTSRAVTLPSPNLGSISEDTLLRVRATAEARLNSLDAELEGHIFKTSLDASEREALKQAQRKRTREVLEEEEATESEEKTAPGFKAFSAEQFPTALRPVSRPLGLGSGLDAGIGTGTFMSNRFSLTLSSGTQGLGGFQRGALLSHGSNTAALYGHTAIQGGFSALSRNDVDSVSFARVG